ncbi:DUF2505 family protein [Acinetobacter modestus]|uniref:DUF2505 family protein n=1 Tax=Acinetobacter modestus TaxID=1776740 RepID=UPI003208733B
MAHHFTVKQELVPGSLEEARKILSNQNFHLEVCSKIPSENLKILSTGFSGPQYYLKRSQNLEVNIPDIAKKLLKGAFRLVREDQWDIEHLVCKSSFEMNMPSSFKNLARLTEENGKLFITVDWEVNVNVPLIGKMLAKHAESEIRRFSNIEIEIVRNEIQSKRYN